MKSTSSKVRINPDEQGNAIRVSKTNAEYAHIRLTQEKVSFNAQGWVNRKVLSTLVHGKLADLQSLNFQPNQELSGHIFIKEQTEPFGDPNRDLKIAGETGIVCQGVDQETGEVKDIYRKTFYDASGTQGDILIAHVNGNEIREANGNAAPSSKKTITQDELNKVLEKSNKKEEKEEEVQKPKEEEVVMEDETFEL